MALTKDQILESNDLKNEAVEVPQWGGTVYVRTMNGVDRDAFENSMIAVLPDGTRKADMTNVRAKLIALTAVDENGVRRFDVGDVDRIGLKSAAAIELVFAVAQRINGLGSGAEAVALKNSKADQAGDSSSV